jgi:hypothetical protein
MTPTTLPHFASAAPSATAVGRAGAVVGPSVRTAPGSPTAPGTGALLQIDF